MNSIDIINEILGWIPIEEMVNYKTISKNYYYIITSKIRRKTTRYLNKMTTYLSPRIYKSLNVMNNNNYFLYTQLKELIDMIDPTSTSTSTIKQSAKSKDWRNLKDQLVMNVFFHEIKLKSISALTGIDLIIQKIAVPIPIV